MNSEHFKAAVHTNLIAYLYHRYITTKSRHHPNYSYRAEAVTEYTASHVRSFPVCVCVACGIEW